MRSQPGTSRYRSLTRWKRPSVTRRPTRRSPSTTWPVYWPDCEETGPWPRRSWNEPSLRAACSVSVHRRVTPWSAWPLAEIRALERARPAGRELAGEARELAASSGDPPNTMARLDALDQLLDRTAQRTAVLQRRPRRGAHRPRAVHSAREARQPFAARTRRGAPSVTQPVKDYARILHRKLGAHTRANAGARGRDLDPI
jgi:hypothetical protein